MRKKDIFKGISGTIFLLGLTSFFTDMSSEIIVPILPLFVASLGASGVIIGLLGGMTDAVTSLFRVYSGHLSDRLGERKKLVLGGYGLSSIAKLLLSFSTSWLQVLIFRPFERIGKGLREPPRDALASETTPRNKHGLVFGILRLMDTAGAVVGASLAFILLSVLGLSFNNIVLIAAAIAFFALIPASFIKDHKSKPDKTKLSISLSKLPKDFKKLVFIIAIFSLADFSYMFFILKASEATGSATLPILLYMIFNLIYALFAMPIGILSDRIGYRKVLMYGYLIFSATLIGFSMLTSLSALIILFMLYGLSYAFIVGTERAFASNLINKRYGSAFGAFHTVTGLISLPASIAAGFFWQINTSLPFIVGAAISLIATIMLIAFRKKI